MNPIENRTEQFSTVEAIRLRHATENPPKSIKCPILKAFQMFSNYVCNMAWRLSFYISIRRSGKILCVSELAQGQRTE